VNNKGVARLQVVLLRNDLGNLCAGVRFCSDGATSDAFLIPNQFSVGKGGAPLVFVAS
jgi:hypothetical protein